MTGHNYARYPLEFGGHIHNWLACGPVVTPLDSIQDVVSASGSPFGPHGRWVINYVPASLSLKERIYRKAPRHEWHSRWRPGPVPELYTMGPGGRARWEYATAGEDHTIDLSLFSFTLTWMDGWLFARLAAERPLDLSAELRTVGPARVWINGHLQVHHTEFGYVEPSVVPLDLSLVSGWNDLWLHCEMIAWREARMALGLRLKGRPPVTVGLPLGDVSAEDWHRAEDDLEQLYLKQSAFSNLPVRVYLDPEVPGPLQFEAEASIPLPTGDITLPVDTARFDAVTGRKRITIEPGDSAELPVTADLAETLTQLPNEFHLRLQLRPVGDTPFAIERAVTLHTGSFNQQPYDDYDLRRREALDTLSHMPHQVLGAIAAVETGRSDSIASEAVILACQFLEERYDCADFYALSLMVLLELHGDTPALRSADQRRIENAFRHFKFWIDEPGLDAMCTYTENHQILYHVTAYLAGQRWPGRVFDNSGHTGRRLKFRAQRRTQDWILPRLRGGFSEWDSGPYLTLDAFAMLALVEFATSARLREMARALLHKFFFSLACQSYLGVHGCSQGRAYVSALKTARVDEASGLQRIAWGLGGFNGETRATGLLALARSYRVPDLIQRIGAHLPDQLLTRACSAGRYRPHFDLRRGPWQVNTLTCRTPDGMLSAAVDYHPGQPGWQEHLWQATLGPETVVFATHPGNSKEDGISRPNFWAGSARMPRVGMVDNTLVCLYDLSLGGGLGFTHAYFPTAVFDEYVITGPWAFGRAGKGYSALWGDGDLQLTANGCHAAQELRSRGPGQAWLCHVGRAAKDGSFADFCRRVSARPPWVRGLSLNWRMPGGQTLGFGWDGPLLLDGLPQLLSGYPHYENAYTHTPHGADTMTIRHGEETLVLDLALGRVVS